MSHLTHLVTALGDLGIPTHLVQGIDWGYGRKLDGVRDGKRDMYFTAGAVERLLVQGALSGSPFGVTHTFAREFSVSWQRMYRVDLFLQGSKVSPLYRLEGSCGDSGFGCHTMGYHFRPRSVASIQAQLESKIRSLPC